MTHHYESIFDSATIITKKDLCALLNLDLTRPGLDFTDSEIKKAYRVRALRFHPDKQKIYTPAFPEELCKQLLSDIEKAKDYLLAGEDNIPGKGFQNQSFSFESKPIIASVIDILHSFKANKPSIESAVFWLNLGSSSFLALLPLAAYSDGQLNLRYINILSKQLAEIRPYIKDIDGSTVANFLRFLRQSVNHVDELQLNELMIQLRAISPKLAENLDKNAQWEQLMVAIKESKEELNALLTDDFINKVQHIISFWPQIIATVPTWAHLLEIYVISTLFTATSLPKYFNAIKVLLETISIHKGLVVAALVSLPLLAVSTLLLPINIAINLSQSIAWTALKAMWQLFVNGIVMVNSLVNVLSLIGAKDSPALIYELFNLMEASFNLSIRLSLNVGLELANAMLFILCNKNLLVSFKEDLNSLLDAGVAQVRTQFDSQYNDNKLAAQQLIIVDQLDSKQEQLGQEHTASAPEPTIPGVNFFQSSQLHNKKDNWLDDLLAQITNANQAGQEALAPSY